MVCSVKVLCLIRQCGLQKCWTSENKWNEHVISLHFFSSTQGHATRDLGLLVLGLVSFWHLPKFVLDASCFLYTYIFFFFWPLRTDQHTHLGEPSVNGPV